MSRKRRSIKQKIITVILSVSLVSLAVVIMVSFFSMINMRRNVIRTSDSLGQTAAGDSQAALEAQAVIQLTDIAKNKAKISDEKLGKLQKYVQIIANQCSEIYSNPTAYLPAEVQLPMSVNNGIITPQLIYSKEYFDTASVSAEINLVSNINNLLCDIPKNDPEVYSTYIGTESGFTIKADKDSDSSMKNLDPRTRPWYILAKEKNGPIWTDVYDDAMGRGLTITTAAPFYNNEGDLMGIAGIDSLLTNLNDIILGTKIGETGYAFVLNEKGDMIISPTIQKVDGKIVRENFLEIGNLNLRSAAEKMIARKSGFERLVYQGREVFLAYAPIESIPWSIATVMDVNEVIAPALQSKTGIIDLTSKAIREVDRNIITVSILFAVVSAASIMFIILFSFILSGRITRPLAYLTGMVSEAHEGDFDMNVDIKTGDEIEELAGAFSNMSVELKKYIANLASETAEREKINSELAVAAGIQGGMLPKKFPAFPEKTEFDIFARMRMAKEVGGDFYDYYLIGENKLAFVIADVSGKGIPAALFMMMTKIIIKSNALAGYDIGDILYRANNSLCESNDSNMFVTVFLGIIDFKKGLLSYVNAGHNPPLFQKAGGDYDWLKVNSGFVLGIMENTSFKPKKMKLSKGDRIFCYTDGVTEAMNNKDELYSENRLVATLNEKKDLPGLTDLIAAIKDDVDIFADGAEQADDITMLAVELKH